MNVGGPAIQVYTISKGLPEEDFEQILLTGKCEPGELDYLELNDIKLPKLEVPGLGRSINFISDLKALLFIRKQILVFKPDIIHTHTFKAGVLGRITALSIRRKTVKIHTFHGHLLEGYLKSLKLWILLQIERFLAARTDVLISVGNRVMEDLLEQRIGMRNKYRVIPPGFQIDHDLENKARPRSKIERRTEFKCAWIGRLVDIKRPERVLEIARLLKERNSKAGILVVGDGPLRESIENQSKEELLPVTFMGWQSNIHQILTHVDALILTSANEGTPISIIEAQRLGRPVVATNVGSVSEVMIPDESGFILDYDANNFSKKIEMLVEEEDLYLRFAAKAREFASERFSAERLVNDHVELYKNSKKSPK